MSSRTRNPSVIFGIALSYPTPWLRGCARRHYPCSRPVSSYLPPLPSYCAVASLCGLFTHPPLLSSCPPLPLPSLVSNYAPTPSRLILPAITPPYPRFKLRTHPLSIIITRYYPFPSPVSNYSPTLSPLFVPATTHYPYSNYSSPSLPSDYQPPPLP